MSTVNIEIAHETEINDVQEADTINIIMKAIDEHKDHSLVNSILEKVRATLAEKLENNHSLFRVLKHVMESVEIEEIQDMNKKELVESVMKALVEESDMSDEEKNICLVLIVSGTMGDTIDLVVSATRGEFAINKKTKKRLLSCIGKCIK